PVLSPPVRVEGEHLPRHQLPPLAHRSSSTRAATCTFASVTHWPSGCCQTSQGAPCQRTIACGRPGWCVVNTPVSGVMPSGRPGTSSRVSLLLSHLRLGVRSRSEERRVGNGLTPE